MSSFQFRFKSLAVLLTLVCITRGDQSALAFEPIQNQLLGKARAFTQQGITPVFVFDLDETTLDSSPRRLAATHAVASALCAANPQFSRECAQLEQLTLEDIYGVSNVYDNALIFRSIGIHNPKFSQLFEKPIVDEYLSGRHLQLDFPHRGADDFIRALRAVHAEIYYVSSRFDDVQRAGSMRVLVQNGMISRHAANHLILRPRGMASIDFKKQALSTIKAALIRSQQPKVMVGVYENEPENINAMLETFPQATGVFITGACIECSVKVNPQAHGVEQY